MRPKKKASHRGTLFDINEINGLTDSISLIFNEWVWLTERALAARVPGFL
jgi:hypothetical protein